MLRISAGSWQQYRSAIHAWIAYCTRVGASPLGAPAPIAAAFLEQRRKTAAWRRVGHQHVTQASAAITALHEAASLPSPCASQACAVVRAAARRTLVTRRQLRPTATAAEVRKLVDRHLQPGVSLRTRMVVTCALLSFSAFLRYSDLKRVMVHHQLMVRGDRSLQLRLFCGKTDKAARGEQVTVGRIGGPYCPVGRVEELLQQGGYRTKPEVAQRPDPTSAQGRLRWEEVEDTGPLLRATNPSGSALSRVNLLPKAKT